MIYGYARVSTKDQNLNIQIEELKKLGAEKIFSEKISGKNREREQLKNLLEQLRKEDTLIVSKIDRLGRSLKDLIFLFDTFIQKEIKIQIGTLKLDFSTAEGKVFGLLFGIFSEFEREIIRERTMRGLEQARMEGRIGGKPKGISKEGMIKAKKAYELREKGLKTNEIMKITDIKSTRTMYKYIREYAGILAAERGLNLAEDGLSINYTGDGIGVYDEEREVYKQKQISDGGKQSRVL